MPSHNKVIAKNTIFLYIRMIVLMLVKLYTTRVLLEVLGVDDYGIWTLVYGFVIAFSFISPSLATATQRFLNYDQGVGGSKQTQIFSSSLLLALIVDVILVLILETGGVWFVNHKLDYPSETYHSVSVVFQCCVVILAISFIRIPFEALIISHEKFSFYAFISLIEAGLLLGAIMFLKYWPIGNSLIIYSYLSLLITVLLFLVYVIYCKNKFNCTKINLFIDKHLLLDISKFSGWTIFGSVASMTSNQGLNILLNIFSGLGVNAAFGISNQIKVAFSLLTNNILKASNPRIVKLYAQQEVSQMMELTITISKIAFLLILSIGSILINFMPLVLSLWLGKSVPEYTNIFCSLAIVQVLLVCLSSPLDTVIFSTGKIKAFQIVFGAILFLNIILSYIFLKIGYSPTIVLIIKCGVEFLIVITRIIFIQLRIGFSIKQYIITTLIPAVILIIFSYSCIKIINLICHFNQNLIDMCLFSIIYFPILLIVGLSIILNKSQRVKAINKLYHILTPKDRS